MAALPPEPREGCTLRLEIQPRNQAPRRLERKFDGDDTGENIGKDAKPDDEQTAEVVSLDTFRKRPTN